MNSNLGGVYVLREITVTQTTYVIGTIGFRGWTRALLDRKYILRTNQVGKVGLKPNDATQSHLELVRCPPSPQGSVSIGPCVADKSATQGQTLDSRPSSRVPSGSAFKGFRVLLVLLFGSLLMRRCVRCGRCRAYRRVHAIS